MKKPPEPRGIESYHISENINLSTLIYNIKRKSINGRGVLDKDLRGRREI